MSGQLGSMFGSDQPERKVAARAEVTGSIKPRPGLPPDADLAYAKAAVADLMSRGGKDSSTAWENPSTGARGTVTPIASVYTQDGTACREFLASHVRGSAEAWLQGEACQQPKGQWEVKTMRPWTRS